jgi:hypothetical protein
MTNTPTVGQDPRQSAQQDAPDAAHLLCTTPTAGLHSVRTSQDTPDASHLLDTAFYAGLNSAWAILPTDPELLAYMALFVHAYGHPLNVNARKKASVAC